MNDAGLQVRNLRVTYTAPPPVRAVDDISLQVNRGECLGIVGESASGKSTLARALLGVAGDARVEGEVRLDGLNLASLDEQGWRAVRWRRMALAFQYGSSLNPVLSVGEQVAEPLRVHLGMGERLAMERAKGILSDVGLGSWAADRYPSQLSGGQRRLALVAVAGACNPDVLVLDEPTAGLDALTRDVLLGFLRRFASGGDKVMLLLSHHVEAVAALEHRVAVLYRGWLAELGPVGTVLDDPRHPSGCSTSSATSSRPAWPTWPTSASGASTGLPTTARSTSCPATA